MNTEISTDTDTGLDKKFFASLYQRRTGRVLSALGRLGIPSRDREDLVHEVFTVAVRKYRRALPEEAEVAWLLMVTHNVARNFHRRPYRRELPVFAPGAPGSSPAEPADHRSPEQHTLELEIYTCVHSVMDDSLDDELHLVFTLAYLEGVSTDDLAKLLNVPPTTIQSMLRRARNAFIEEWRKRYGEGALFSAFPLLAAVFESRWKALASDFLKYVGAAGVGAGLALALTQPAVPLLHAERTRLAEARWYVAAAPPAVEPSQPTPNDIAPASPVPRSREEAAHGQTAVPLPAVDEVDESVRDELALIDAAEWAMKRGKYADAMQYIERHRRTYPDGRLSARRNRLIAQVKQLTGRSRKISG